VLNLGEAVVGRSRSCCRLRGVVGPALGAGDWSGLVRSLGLSRVARNDLERLAEGLVLTTSLLVPLSSCGSISGFRLNASYRRRCRLLDFCPANCR
jgi:hypothetical protein